MWLVVWVHFNVLVLNTLLFERDPDALDEGTEPARVELQIVFGGVCLGVVNKVMHTLASSLTWTVFAARPVASGWRFASGWSLPMIAVVDASGWFFV